MYISKWVVGCGMNKEEARAQSYLRKKERKKKVIGTATKKSPTNKKKKLNVKSAASMAGREEAAPATKTKKIMCRGCCSVVVNFVRH